MRVQQTHQSEPTQVEQMQIELAKIERTEAVLSHLQILSLHLTVVPTINAHAAALPLGEISELLQNPNIEGHTSMYWAVVDGRREAFSVFTSHILQFTSICSFDLRLACMLTSVHALFTQLKSGHVINRERKHQYPL